jgi:geranylgeranyl diphosphate synthase, type I
MPLPGESLAARLVAETADREATSPAGGVDDAATALRLLEDAMRAHAGLLEGRHVSEHGGPAEEPRSVGLAGISMIGRAAEVIAECGDHAVGLWTRAAHDLVRAEMLEVEDLYDAARSRARCLSVAELRTGSLLALATRLGGQLSGTDEHSLRALDEYGRQLGIAAEIRGDVLALGDPPWSEVSRRALGSGRYTLPVVCAIESEPELARRLGRPLDDDDAASVLDEVHAAGGIKAASQEVRRRARAAKVAIDGMPAEALRSIADEVTAPGGG